MRLFTYTISSVLFLLLILSCGSNKPNVQVENKVEPQLISVSPQNDKISDQSENLLVDQTDYITNQDSKVELEKKEPSIINNSDKQEIISETNNHNPSSNYIRVKTVYELAMETNPPLFLPHDEFETVNEYKIRVSDQVRLMKEIVQITAQKTEIKKAKRIQVAEEKELKRRSVIETLMAESSSQVEFHPDDIGRYDPENETFPLVLHDTQYQISVPREEARTFKTNFESIKIKGIQQLKPKFDVRIKVPRAHIRSRPNGSIIGVASNLDQFEHIVDVDEWYKINFKGQFGFTHMNNAELKLIDIANEYEYHDLVAIHPTTGTMFSMTSVDKLVKAPLNLASRKYESGKPDGPNQNY